MQQNQNIEKIAFKVVQMKIEENELYWPGIYGTRNLL